MATDTTTEISAEDYLRAEQTAATRREFLNGEIFEMAGASVAHNDIVFNLQVCLHEVLRGGDCRVNASDLRVRCPSGLYTYPDVIITRGDRDIDTAGGLETLLNPLVIIEVLSPTTEAYDRGEKFEHYRTIDSLQEYFLIAQDRVAVDCFRRNGGAEWAFRAAKDQLEIASLDLTIEVARIYDRVTLATE